jgi:hypothetical protein
MQTGQQSDCGEQQRIVGERGEKLRGQDNVEPPLHGIGAGGSGESGVFLFAIIACSAGRFIPQ